MAAIWSEKNRYAAWLEVEILAAEAWSKLGEIPAADVQALRAHAKFDVDRIHEIEAVTHHDVVAFTRDVSESLGAEKKWVHFGLTSTDVVDTAQGYLLKQANEILRADLAALKAGLAKLAKAHKDTVMMGRTHGVHAEPTTFGLVVATWYSELKRTSVDLKTRLAMLKLVRLAVQSVPSPIRRLLLRRTSQSSWVFALKKSRLRFCRVICMRITFRHLA